MLRLKCSQRGVEKSDITGTLKVDSLLNGSYLYLWIQLFEEGYLWIQLFEEGVLVDQNVLEEGPTVIVHPIFRNGSYLWGQNIRIDVRYFCVVLLGLLAFWLFIFL